MTHHADRQAAAEQARQLLATPDAIILDTETTNLRGYLVQIAVIDMQGQVLLDTLVNPLTSISLDAQRIHHITAETVASAPTFNQIVEPLGELLAGRVVVVYNASFDSQILYNEIFRFIAAQGTKEANIWQEANGWVKACTWRCAMHLYAQWVGDWNSYHGNYRWQPLPGGDHTALGDARATLAVLQQMATEGGSA